MESKQKHNNTSDGTFSATDSGENWTPNDIQTTEKNGLEDVETIGLLTPDSVKTNSTKGDSASLESDIEVQEKKTEYNSSSEYAFESSDDSPVFNSDFESYISTPEEESSEANENIDDWEGPPAESF